MRVKSYYQRINTFLKNYRPTVKARINRQDIQALMRSTWQLGKNIVTDSGYPFSGFLDQQTPGAVLQLSLLQDSVSFLENRSRHIVDRRPII